LCSSQKCASHPSPVSGCEHVEITKNNWKSSSDIFCEIDSIVCLLCKKILLCAYVLEAHISNHAFVNNTGLMFLAGLYSNIRYLQVPHIHTQTHTYTHRHTQTHTDTHRHTQTHTDTHTDTHKFNSTVLCPTLDKLFLYTLLCLFCFP
jgi:hypothetical protein